MTSVGFQGPASWLSQIALCAAAQSGLHRRASSSAPPRENSAPWKVRTGSEPSSAGRLRLFIAIPLPEAVKEALRKAQVALMETLPRQSANWSRPENMHLTLRFLGGVDPARAAELAERLRKSLAGFGAVEMACERLGCFPDPRFPRVVWAGAHDAGDRLRLLHRLANDAAEGFAESPPEPHFTGHVTLARPKRINRPEAERLAAFVRDAAGWKFGGWRCGSVKLIQSVLSPQGSRYTTLDEFPLLPY